MRRHHSGSWIVPALLYCCICGTAAAEPEPDTPQRGIPPRPPASTRWLPWDLADEPEPFVRPSQIIGTDTRTRITNTHEFPWSAVVQIEHSGGNGTGTMISPFHVVTAAHVVDPDKNGVAVNAAAITVTPGRDGTRRPFCSVGVTQVRMFPAWIADPQPVLGHDLALLTLNRNVGAQTGHLGAAARDDADLETFLLNLAGYPVQQPGHPADTMWWAEDATTDVFATRVFHVIDTESGQSGSSLWRDIEGLPLMVAVHSGAQGDENHATRLVQAKIDWLIARIAEDTPPNDQPELTTYSAEPAVFDPETTHCRGPLDASVFVTNQCGDAVADSVDVLFLLGEPSTPQISIILDTASVGPLVPGEGNQANAAVNAEIPVEVDDGIYELRWVIDPGNAHFERDENNNDGTLGGEEITITRRPPSYPPVQDVTIDCGGGYTGPQPALVDPVCMNPVTWSLDEGPEGMTINPMGVVNWPAPTVGTHTIKIRASNSGGFATRTWHLIVRALVPVVIPPPDETIDCCEPYSSPVPMLTNPVCMSPPHAPAVWALDAGPGGMGINPTTGQVGWGGVTGTDHLVQIAAANSRGVGGAGYSLTVENDCNENGVADDTEPDADGDGVIDACDNCPADSNEDQKDTDGDGDGDECDDDDDGDGIPDAEDNCPGDPNPGQEDGDGDGVGDDCDNCPGEDNPGQGDIDDDGDGDDCDDDMDGDGVDNPDDNCPPVPNPQQGDVPFPETIVPFTDDALHWATAVDVDWVRGELTHVSQYTTNGSGSASDATQLDDPVAPAPGFGFFYLISLGGDCTAASWQSSIGAEPQRDAALP